jgi:hypothetical protein
MSSFDPGASTPSIIYMSLIIIAILHCMPYPTKRGRCLAPRELPFTADSPDPLGTLAVSNARTAPETIWKALAALAVSDAAAANSTAANYTPKALAALAVAERHIPRSLRFARDRGRSATPLRRERASPFQSTRHRTAPLATAPKPHRSHTPPQPTALLAPVARFARFRRCVTPPSHGTARGPSATRAGARHRNGVADRYVSGPVARGAPSSGPRKGGPVPSATTGNFKSLVVKTRPWASYRSCRTSCVRRSTPS